MNNGRNMFELGNEDDINKHAESRSQIRPLTLLLLLALLLIMPWQDESAEGGTFPSFPAVSAGTHRPRE